MPIKRYEAGSQLILPVVVISKAIPYLLHSVNATYSLSAGAVSSLAWNPSGRG